MRNILMVFAAVLGVSLASAAAVVPPTTQPAPPPAPVNLVTNGDFEKAGQGTPLAGWRSGNADGGALTQDTTVKQDGAASLKLSVTKKGNIWTASEPFAVKTDHYYLVSFAYRAEGFGDKGWVGADDSARLLFLDEKNAQIAVPMGGLTLVGYPWVVGFPYADVKEWKTAVAIMRAPAGAVKAEFQVALNNTNEALSPSAWLDNVRVIEYLPADAKGKTYTFKPNAPLHLYNCEMVDGNAVSTKGKQKAGTMVSGPYTKDVPCGLYAVTYRLKTAENTLATPLLQLTVESDGILGNRVGNLLVKGTDFKAADTFQDFTVQAFRAPTGWLAFPVYWSGEATVTLESVTVTEIKTLTADEWAQLLK